jgi:hypothetical protein
MVWPMARDNQVNLCCPHQFLDIKFRLLWWLCTKNTCCLPYNISIYYLIPPHPALGESSCPVQGPQIWTVLRDTHIRVWESWRNSKKNIYFYLKADFVNSDQERLQNFVFICTSHEFFDILFYTPTYFSFSTAKEFFLSISVHYLLTIFIKGRALHRKD